MIFYEEPFANALGNKLSSKNQSLLNSEQSNGKATEGHVNQRDEIAGVRL